MPPPSISDMTLALRMASSSPGNPDATHSLMALSRARLSFLLIASSSFLSKASGDLVPDKQRILKTLTK